MRIAIVISLVVVCSLSRAQHVPLQSQYMFNGIALNPAYTGSEDALSIVGTFRAQWVGFPGAPLTQAVTAHAPIKRTNSSIGIQIYADQIGVSRNTGIFGSYSYRLGFHKTALIFGASGGVNFIKTRFSELTGNDAADPLVMNDSPLGVLPDFSFGMHYYGEKFFLSFSAPMFLSHEYDGLKFKLENNFRNYNLMLGGGYVFKLKNEMELKPSVLAKYKADSNPQVDINLMVTFNKTIDIGVSYRTQEAIIGLIKINANDQLSFMYSFGLPLSPILKYTYGSHELSVKYNFIFRSPLTSPRFLGY